MNKIKEVLLSKQARRFYWTFADGFVAFAIVWVGGINLWWAPLVMALLTSLTKEVNNRLSQE